MNAAVAFVSAFRWDVVWQARNGFYWASAFLVLMVGGLLHALPEPARVNDAVWVPAVIVTILQVTTFFFVTGLLLLERAEGTLIALAVAPASATGVLAVRTMSLTAVSHHRGARCRLDRVWPDDGVADRALRDADHGGHLHQFRRGRGVTLHRAQHTVVTGVDGHHRAAAAPIAPFRTGATSTVPLHPLEPAMTMIRAAYRPLTSPIWVFGAVGCVLWGTMAFVWGRRSLSHMMRSALVQGRP